MKYRFLSLFLSLLAQTKGFVPKTSSSTRNQVSHNHSSIYTSTSQVKPATCLHEKEKGVMDILSMKVDIPEEVREEIFRAEANTPAAQDRQTRIILYAAIALLGIGFSSLNVFLSNIRAEAGLAPDDLSAIRDIGFGWVEGSIFSFFLLNKIGGGIALIAAGFGGTMVELEQRTKNENAEKIWQELQRRREKGPQKKQKDKKLKKKKQKNKKRLSALSEVILEEETTTTTVATPQVTEDKDSSNVAATEEKKEGGLMDKMKDFYDQADKMAASQALLLNKELEDKGVIDKITDESGLKVIGKEAASKLDKEKNDKN